MRVRSIAAVFVAVLLVGSLAGCSKKDSGSSDESTDKTEETEKSTTTTEDASGDGSSTDDSSLDEISDLMGDCGKAYLAFSTMMASSGAFMGGATDEQIQELEQQAEELQGAVPDDLQDDMQVLTDAYEEFGKAIADGGFMSEEAQQATENLDSDEVKAAQANIEEYFNSCEN